LADRKIEKTNQAEKDESGFREEQMPANSTACHTDRVQAAIASNGAAKSALIASWRRSSNLHGLDPAARKPPQRLSDAQLRLARQELDPLIQLAQSTLDRLYFAVGGVGCCVLLANRDGIPVERRGAPGDDTTFNSWGLWPGTSWSEESEGTNGNGTCLVEQRPVTIHRDQHYLARNTLLSCTTAPVHDHEGNLIAALDISSCRADLTEGFANLIAMAANDAATRIEVECFRLAYPGARILVVPGTDKAARALIAVDADDLVIGATRAARQALGITSAYLRKSLPAADLLDAAGHANENLASAERGVLHRALARADGNVTAAAEALGMSRATLYRKLQRLELHRAH
jgi:transcriptional regulator of acetoin/glycerol metabolism